MSVRKIVEIFVELLDNNELPLIGNEVSEGYFDDTPEAGDVAI